MAELCGLISGAAGLAGLTIQLVESTKKLKRFCNHFKDADDTITGIISNFECLVSMLNDVNLYPTQSPHPSPLLSRCVTACQQAISALNALTDKYERYACRFYKGVGKLYVAMKSEEIKDLLLTLEQAKSSLLIALILYKDDYKKQPNAIEDQVLAGHAMVLDMLARFTSSNRDMYERLQQIILAVQNVPVRASTIAGSDTALATMEKSSSQDGNLRHCKGCRKHRGSRSTRRFRIMIFAFHITVKISQSGWKIRLRTYNIVSHDSPVFLQCRLGKLADLQRLIETGVASPLDVCREDGTLLAVAAYHGHFDICSYLMGQTTWPDQASVFTHALDCLALGFQSQNISAWLRLFTNALGFEAELSPGNSSRIWPVMAFHSDECLDIVLRDVLPGFCTYNAQSKYETITDLGYDMINSPTTLLQCIGLDILDPQLASLKSRDDLTMMHHVADRAGWLYAQGQGFEEWIDLGRSLLRHGADPCALTHYPGLTPGCTPLIDFLHAALRACMGRLKCRASLEIINKAIKQWALMLELGGKDLQAYGRSENGIWQDISIKYLSSIYERPLKGIAITELVYGRNPASWGLKVQQWQDHSIEQLVEPPGNFPTTSRIPKQIAWQPNEIEDMEGIWRTVSSFRLFGAPVRLDHMYLEDDEPFVRLVERRQDDAGVVVLMIDAARSRKSRRAAQSRSRSQPPLVRRREVAYCAQRHSDVHQTLPSYHLCPYNGRWRLGCRTLPQESRLSDFERHLTFDVRSCIQGCYDDSFQGIEHDLADPQQHNTRLAELGLPGHTRNCGEGCCRVHFSTFRVLKSVQRNFPVPRRYSVAVPRKDGLFKLP